MCNYRVDIELLSNNRPPTPDNAATDDAGGRRRRRCLCGGDDASVCPSAAEKGWAVAANSPSPRLVLEPLDTCINLTETQRLRLVPSSRSCSKLRHVISQTAEWSARDCATCM